MLKIIQYLQKNQNILNLLEEGKVSLLNVNPLEKQLILEAFSYGEKPTPRDSYLLYWRT